MAEANDNRKFLQPLVPHLNKLRDMDEFKELPRVFPTVLHTVRLI